MEINATLLGQALTFAVLIWFSMKFVWPPLNNMLEERAKKISDGIANARLAQERLISVEREVEQELKNAQKQAMEILAQAQRQAAKIIDESVVEAKHQAELLQQQMQISINNQLKQVKHDLQTEFASLVVKAAQEIIEAEIDPGKHQQILERIKLEL